MNGNYTAWSAWKECSATCGGGIQQRVRTCTNPTPKNGGKDCAVLGPAVETKDCNSQPCPSKQQSFCKLAGAKCLPCFSKGTGEETSKIFNLL